jgi:truncated hemoglobin YjbI
MCVQVREEECVTKVQAIVRMRLQASKYGKLVDAARTLQNAWRLRMFSADRSNHERVAEFLRSLMAGPDHKGGSGGGPRV